jgi:mannose/fructose/N-acetylgalactosamine-specific phosphotransferase system component IIB
VIVGWLRALKATQIVVANDEAASDPMRKALMEIACPPSVKLAVLSVEKTARLLIRGMFDDEKVILLTEGPRDIYRLVELGVEFKSINIGGMRFYRGKQQILPSVSINEEEKGIFLKLSEHGIELEGRAVPTDERVNILDFIKDKKGKE